jgi:hypothetical protein
MADGQIHSFDRASQPGPGEKEVREREERVARFLDAQLDSICGTQFSAVVEHEFKAAMEARLYEAMKKDPSRAVGVLERMLRSEYAVELFFEMLKGRLQETDFGPEGEELLRDIPRPRQLKLASFL